MDDRVSADVQAGARVLVAEDNRDAADSLAKLLELFGYEVRVARNGPQTIAAAVDWRPGFILLDIGMPAMDGYEVATRLRKEASCRETVIIAVTGYGQEDDRRRSRAVGIDHHLLKPVASQVLLSLLSRSEAMSAVAG
jgi:CheY-like chemotaxis protein